MSGSYTCVFPQVELDKWTWQVALVKLTRHPRLWPLFKSLDKWQLVTLGQLVKSTCVVTPLKSNPQAVPRTHPEGYWGRGQVTVMAQKRVKIDRFFIFFLNGEHGWRLPIFELVIPATRFLSILCHWLYVKRRTLWSGSWKLWQAEESCTCCSKGTPSNPHTWKPLAPLKRGFYNRVLKTGPWWVSQGALHHKTNLKKIQHVFYLWTPPACKRCS